MNNMINDILENSPLYIPLLQMKKNDSDYRLILLWLLIPEWVLNQFSDESLEVSPNSRDVVQAWTQIFSKDAYSFIKPYKTRSEALYDLIFPIYPTILKGGYFILNGLSGMLLIPIRSCILFTNGYLNYSCGKMLSELLLVNLIGIGQIVRGIINIALSPLDLIKVLVREASTLVHYGFNLYQQHHSNKNSILVKQPEPIEIYSANDAHTPPVHQIIPTDVFTVIMSYLNIAEMNQLRFTSTQWNTAIEYYFSLLSTETYYIVRFGKKYHFNYNNHNEVSKKELYDEKKRAGIEKLEPQNDRFFFSKTNARSHALKKIEEQSVDFPVEYFAVIFPVDYYNIHKYATNQNTTRSDGNSPHFFIGKKENAKISSSGEGLSKDRKLVYLN